MKAAKAAEESFYAADDLIVLPAGAGPQTTFAKAEQQLTEHLSQQFESVSVASLKLLGEKKAIMGERPAMDLAGSYGVERAVLDEWNRQNAGRYVERYEQVWNIYATITHRRPRIGENPTPIKLNWLCSKTFE
jgi:hypothetical protein